MYKAQVTWADPYQKLHFVKLGLTNKRNTKIGMITTTKQKTKIVYNPFKQKPTKEGI